MDYGTLFVDDSLTEMTNTCTCTEYDADKEEWTDEPAQYCYGDCWESALDNFAYDTAELRNSNTTGWWQVNDIQLWDRTVSGYFRAERVEDILRGITVDSQWTLRYRVESDRLVFSLSHHDAPMGSSSSLLPVSESEAERLEL